MTRRDIQLFFAMLGETLLEFFAFLLGAFSLPRTSVLEVDRERARRRLDEI